MLSSGSTQVPSEASYNYPGPPNNTPYNQSLAGDLNLPSIDEVVDQLRNLPGGPTPPNSIAAPAEAEGKAHLRARVRGDVPLLRQLFKRPPKAPNVVKRVRKVTSKALTGVNVNEPREAEDQNHIDHVHEGSTWTHVAMEDISRGLERLAMAADDLHLIDGNKTIEEYYNEKLAQVLKAGKIQFDPKYLE